MDNKVKTLILRCFIGLFIISIASNAAFALVWQNWRECVSSPGCSCTLTLQVTAETTTTLKTYVVESAGYFLKSHTAFQQFLYCLEMSESSGADSADLKSTLYSAIENMEKAKAAYTNLKFASEKIPYNQEMIDQLLKFDYESFRVKNGLNEPIFEKLRVFLGKGDIAGFDTAVIANMDDISNKLYAIKASVDKGLTPEIALPWRTNQAYAEAQLFGQYMSEVFRDILFH
jgi:hypothetical protein